MKNAIEIENLRKTYGKDGVPALHDIRFSVGEGALFGLIGPDGAGKTTLLRILATVLLADKGRASVAGYDVVNDYRQIRSLIGYMPGRFSLYQDLTVAENLHFFATVFGTTVKANYDMIRDIYDQIAPFSNRRAGKLSGGMKQKLALCCALIHKPEVLLLDEPTTGVDVVSRREFWDILRRLKAQGITILVSTPYMDEAARCERIALIQEGRILTVGSPEQLIRSYPDPLFAARSEAIYPLLKDLRAHPGVKSCFAFGDSLHFTLRDPAAGTGALLGYLKVRGHAAVVVTPIRPGIEDSFIKLAEDTGLNP